MSNYIWNGDIDTNIDIEVVTYKNSKAVQPKDLQINRKDIYVEIVASEEFIVDLRIKGQWITSMHSIGSLVNPYRD
jgi:sRNA-binding carbon storage regulator CsrA